MSQQKANRDREAEFTAILSVLSTQEMNEFLDVMTSDDGSDNAWDNLINALGEERAEEIAGLVGGGR